MSQQSYDVVGRAECAALRMNPATFGALPSSACTHATAGVFGADRIAKTVYDAAGQATKTISGFGTGLAQDTITTSYTTNGRVATLTDARGGKTSYDYDGHDRLKKTRFPNPSTANASSTTDYEELSYGTSGASLGLVVARRLRDGTSIAFAYDDLGRLISSDAPGSTPDVSYAYDSFGRVTSLSQSGHSLAYVYDQLSRLVSETQPLGTVSYEYDAAGRRTKLTYPGSYYLDYDWSVAGDLLKIRENGASSGVGVLASYAYDNLGRRAALTRGNGNVTTYGFDAASRLNALDLDLDGATTTNDLAFDFAHNPASQIIDEDSANGAYDWTEPAAFTDNYTVNYLNQYLTAAGATITHDARGNISSDGTTSFTYDAMNRLTSVSGGASADLAYDPASRLYEVAGTATTRFLYDGADIIAEYDGSNALLRRYVHGPGADEALVWLEGTGTSDRRFLIADARGSIVAVTDDAGATTNKNLYDAYGTPHAANAGRFQYTGQIWLAEAGLYHYKARAYSPMLGRFLQTDPIGYGDGMNLYAYVGNDPINGRDPSGMSGVLLCADDPSCDIIWVNASEVDRHAYYSSTHRYRRRAARARADLYSKIEDFGFDLSDYPGIAESAEIASTVLWEGNQLEPITNVVDITRLDVDGHPIGDGSVRIRARGPNAGCIGDDTSGVCTVDHDPGARTQPNMDMRAVVWIEVRENKRWKVLNYAYAPPGGTASCGAKIENGIPRGSCSGIPGWGPPSI